MKTIVMSFFILLLGFSTLFCYNLWSQQPVDDQFGEVIALSNSTSIIQSLSSPQGKTLVPKGSILGSNDVDTLVYNYIIDIEENDDLSVFLDKVLFTKDNYEYQDEYNLLSFDYAMENISETQISLTVSVSLNMPENQTQYNMICNSAITFHLQIN